MNAYIENKTEIQSAEKVKEGGRQRETGERSQERVGVRKDKRQERGIVDG